MRTAHLSFFYRGHSKRFNKFQFSNESSDSEFGTAKQRESRNKGGPKTTRFITLLVSIQKELYDYKCYHIVPHRHEPDQLCQFGLTGIFQTKWKRVCNKSSSPTKATSSSTKASQKPIKASPGWPVKKCQNLALPQIHWSRKISCANFISLLSENTMKMTIDYQRFG